MTSNFRPAASAPARQMIKDAFKDLSSTISPSDSRGFETTTIEHVREAALDIEKQLAARQSLRNMRRLMPLLQGLEHYAKVVDILCNGTPYVAWLWAPITLILRISTEYVEAFEVIMKGYSKIADSLVRFQILGSAFEGNHPFQKTLAVFYSDILRFHKFAYTFVRKRSWKLLFITSWGRFQRRFNSIMEDLDRHGTLIDQEANARHIAESERRWHETQIWRKENEDRLATQEHEQAMKQYRYISSWLKADDSEQTSIYDLASSEGDKYSGTCSWAISNQKLRAWLREDTDSCLCWLQGIPGAGKTVLLTQIMAFMKTKSSRFMITHFLNKSFASSTAYDQILRSILLQLIKEDGDLTAYVYVTYVATKKSTTTAVLEKLVMELFTASSPKPQSTHFIWLLIDSFESCESNKQGSLISLINQLVSKNSQLGSTVCKVLVTSRSSPILSKRLRSNQVISFSEEKQKLHNAIKYYASRRMDDFGEKFDQLHLGHDELRNVTSSIARKADGMFLYARLILDYIERNIFYEASELRKVVDELPTELSDFYRKILQSIIAPLNPESVERIRSLFGWLAFTHRPLKRLELLSAITFGSLGSSAPHLVPDFILLVAAPLLEERCDATLGFIHTTVKEFLQSESSNLVLSCTDLMTEHGIASITCLRAGIATFCGDTTKQYRNSKVVTGLYGFLLYAADHWVDYLLAVMKVASGPVSDMPLYQAALALAVQADRARTEYLQSDRHTPSKEMDDILPLLPDPQVRELVRLTLVTRSPKLLEPQILPPLEVEVVRLENVMTPRTVIQAALASYQEVVVFLLSQCKYSGVTSEELRIFQQQFQNSAFTCRLGSCPHATAGFGSAAERDEHEMAHSKPVICSHPDCKYPNFVSISAMRKHVERVHSVRPPRRQISRPSTLQKSASNSRVYLHDNIEQGEHDFQPEVIANSPSSTPVSQMTSFATVLPTTPHALVSTTVPFATVNLPQDVVPTSPGYAPDSPPIAPNSPPIAPNSPQYVLPNSPQSMPTPGYQAISPGYGPVSPPYVPVSPTGPFAVNSPPYAPISPIISTGAGSGFTIAMEDRPDNFDPEYLATSLLS